MNYRSAFDKLTSIYDYKILRKNFLVRSFLFDYVGNSYIDKELTDAFYILNRNSIYENIRFLSLNDAKKVIKDYISKADKKHTFQEYVKSVEPLLLRLYPKEYMEIKNKTVVKVIKPVRAPIKKATPANIPQPVVKIGRVMKPIASLVVVSKSQNLSIISGQFSDYRIYNKAGVDVTSSLKPKRKNGVIRFDIPGKRGSYTINVPRQNYDKVIVKYTGKQLNIKDNDKFCFITREMKVYSKKGMVLVNTDCDSLRLIQDNGYAIICGDIDSINATMNKTSFSGYLYPSNPTSYSISTSEQNILLDFSGRRIKPKVNAPFRRVQQVNGTYTIGKRKVKLALKTTNKGKIKVK